MSRRRRKRKLLTKEENHAAEMVELANQIEKADQEGLLGWGEGVKKVFRGEYTIDEASRDTFGTDVVLHLNNEGEEDASRWQLENVIKVYRERSAQPQRAESAIGVGVGSNNR